MYRGGSFAIWNEIVENIEMRCIVNGPIQPIFSLRLYLVTRALYTVIAAN